MAHAQTRSADSGNRFPATARLRADILTAPDLNALVTMFGQALSEYGIHGHFCLKSGPAGDVPIVGDSPDLITRRDECLLVDGVDGLFAHTVVLLARPDRSLDGPTMTKIEGYALLFAARAVALQELGNDIETSCELTVRERYVLGRLLAGIAPVDIGIESGLSVQTIAAAQDSAARRLGFDTVSKAIAFAARRGWLAITDPKTCSSNGTILDYKIARSG